MDYKTEKVASLSFDHGTLAKTKNSKEYKTQNNKKKKIQVRKKQHLIDDVFKKVKEFMSSNLGG